MEYLYNSVNYVLSLYSQMNQASFSGAIDIIVIEQPDGTFSGTPFHIRFGKYVVFNYENKYVDIQINGIEIDLKMKLSGNGVAFFSKETPIWDMKPYCLLRSPVSEGTPSVREDDIVFDTQSTSAIVKTPIEKSKKILFSFDTPPTVRKRDTRRRSTSDREIRNYKKQTTAKTMSLRRSASDSHLSVQFVTSTYKRTLKLSAIYKRTLRLSSNQLKGLHLKYGANEATFSITTKFQGTAICMCHIYLYKWSDYLVISDIDGTITKSDVLGHVIPAIGGTWAHAGVTELYTQIKRNNYRIVYLSSRAIGMSHSTKNYLKKVRQGSVPLPDGPILLSPTSVLIALRKEVIERRPDEFKIACLNDLKALFSTSQPFYAGFGNRLTDVKSYCAVGIPKERIFIIDSSGEVTCANRLGNPSNYLSMANYMVDYIFPPLLSSHSQKYPPFNRHPALFERSIANDIENARNVVDAEIGGYKERSKNAKNKREETATLRKQLSRTNSKYFISKKWII